MKFRFLEGFRRQCRDLDLRERAAILSLVLDLQAALADPHRHSGIGLRKLHPSGIWEARVGLSLRVLFRIVRDETTFVFVGSHDEVKRFLKSL